MEALRLLGVRRPEAHLADVPELAAMVDAARAELRAGGLPPERLESELRYGWIGGVLARAVTRAPSRGRTVTSRIDAVALHPVWGWVAFVALMAVVFQGVFAVAPPLGEAIEAGVNALGALVGALLPRATCARSWSTG
jgi:ferrous iron transport protein B